MASNNESESMVNEWTCVGRPLGISPFSKDNDMEEDKWAIIIDKKGRKWRALLADCITIESTKAMIAKELGVQDPVLSINNSFMLGALWTSKVKPDVEIRIINTQPVPHTYPRPPRSNGIPMLKFPTQDLYEAKGFFQLPFFGCTDRVYEFLGDQTGLGELEMYCTLRENAPPERWSNLHGEVCTHGTAIGLELPEVALGKIIAGRLAQLQSATRYWIVVVWKAKILVPKGEHSHNLDGDVVYKWVRYASGDRARSNLQEAFGQGYGVVASWAEIEADDNTVPTFVGRTIADGFFAVVDAQLGET